MTDEQQETIVNEALRKFCEYLNLWWNAHDAEMTGVKDPYTIEKFTVTDYDKGLYGETNWKVLEEPDMELAFPTGLIKIDCTDGDEGSGSQLYVGLQGHFEGDLEISWITHTFDLSTYMIWSHDDGYRKP